MSNLRVMKIEEADLQILMRTLLRLRIEKNHQYKKTMSKHDHSSRKVYSIESALLEDRLIFDLAKK